MSIKNSFKNEEINQLSSQIFRLIKSEPKLTNRNFKKIKKWLENGCLLVALENNQVKGFIAKEKVVGSFYVLNSWFVKKKYRWKGLGEKLINQAIKDKRKNYLASIFENKTVERLKKFGFRKTSLTKLPTRVLLKLALNWNLNSILKHLFQTRSTFLIKKCH